MSRVRACLFVGILSLSQAMLFGQAKTEHPLKAQLLREWDALSAKLATMRSDSVSETMFSRDNKPLWLRRRDTVKVVYNPSGVSHLYDSQDYDETGAVKRREDELDIANGLYGAVLARGRGGEGWVLSKFRGGKDDANFGYRKTRAVPWLLLFDHGVWVPDWVRDERFVITRSEELPGGPVLRVHFTAKLPGDSKAGFIDLDPKRHCCILGYDCNFQTKFSTGARTGRMEYEPGDGIPVLKTLTEEMPTSKSEKFGTRSSKMVDRYTIQYNVSVPNEEFRLSHYGIPEPGGPAPRRTPWYLWLAGGAAACVALAVGFRYLGRRAAARPGGTVR